MGLFKPDAPKVPRVLNKYHGCIPKDAVDITRRGPYGNPFIVGRDGTRAEVIAKYREWLPRQKKLVNLICKEIKGRDVVCVCAPAPCHGDFILKVANGNTNDNSSGNYNKADHIG